MPIPPGICYINYTVFTNQIQAKNVNITIMLYVRYFYCQNINYFVIMYL